MLLSRPFVISNLFSHKKEALHYEKVFVVAGIYAWLFLCILPKRYCHYTATG
jgi:hypothetical protein